MVSAVVHTYNEEKNIGRCLSSLNWADEIVIVDMGSTDNTCKIVRDFKAKIFSFPYTGFVEPARNFGLSKAKGDWILVIDADEEIPKSLVHFLTNELQRPRYDFYRLARKNIVFNKWVKHSGWWPDYQVRFFKKGTVVWTEKIHGVPLTKGKGEDIEAGEKLSIIHYNYQTLDQFIERLNRYTGISAKELYLSNKRFSVKNLFEATTREFINRYFVWEGYKDGIHGIALAFLQSFTELVTYLKLWELESFKEEKVTLKQTEEMLDQEYRLKKYWLINSLLKQSSGFFGTFLLKLKRKFHLYG